jgi:hypothetical protein
VFALFVECRAWPCGFVGCMQAIVASVRGIAAHCWSVSSTASRYALPGVRSLAARGLPVQPWQGGSAQDMDSSCSSRVKPLQPRGTLAVKAVRP